MNNDSKIVITGAAGLVGQNLVLMLSERGYKNIVGIDMHEENIEIMKKVVPGVQTILADVSEKGEWESSLDGAEIIIMLQAQITSKFSKPFAKNNVQSTRLLLDAIKKYAISYAIQISSSVVVSVADDDYTNTKKEQEELVKNSGITYCVLRPTLMFGWFDKKHLGWLSRFMERVSVYPIPGSGKYLRQPLYVRDFCNVIIKCMENQPHNSIYDIIGKEEVYYIDIIRAIKRAKELKTIVVCIPYGLFWFLMKVYALFSDKPPFTTEQLKALTAGDYFPLTPWWEEIGVECTPFEQAIRETFCHLKYSKIVLKP